MSARQSIWFITGSQHLYGDSVLKQVAANSNQLVAGLNAEANLPLTIEFKSVVTTPDEIHKICLAATGDDSCVGVVLWMHTFSPAKMWIKGLQALQKPWMHLHTQFNDELPWQSIDMDFMNLNQSAHGCREFGYIGTRLGINRFITVGHWKDPEVHQDISDWMRAVIGWNETQNLKIARFGDNMRQVAVTEGNKVSAQIQFGYEVHAYGVGKLVEYCDAVSEADLAHKVDEYCNDYELAFSIQDAEKVARLKNDARLEIGMERFLTDNGCMAFTNTFEDLTGMTNLPGLATQRLMAKGYGYGGEGDWKTAAMVRILKAMSVGLEGGTSFMEDYTYHFGKKAQVLGAHMLEVCPSITTQKPVLDIQRHTIGCKEDIARLIFSANAGPSRNLTTIDLGDRFRFILNELNTIEPTDKLPHLPVAHALWEPLPDLRTSAKAWIMAGGAHHSAYTQAVSREILEIYADMVGVEMVVIDADTNLRKFGKELG
ncbi:MAG: L-arabinose isomerase [Reinekea sp.]|jgi:L-arabinose isomerase